MNIKYIILLFILFPNIILAETKVGWLKKYFGNLSWKEMIEASKTPKEICSFVKNKISYEFNYGFMKTAEQTWNDGKGNCEDMANCILEACDKKGVQANMHIFYEEGNLVGHAVVIGEFNGQKWMASSGIHRNINSIEQAKTIVSMQLGWNRNQVNNIPWQNTPLLIAKAD